jgi:hypothetical protein
MIVKGSYQKYSDLKDQYGFISASDLKGCRTPLEFITKYRKKKKEGKPEFVVGSAFHSLILEPECFYQEYGCFDDSARPFQDKDYRTKENKEYKDNFFAQAKGVTLITKEDYDNLFRMKEAVYSQLPILPQILDFSKGMAEANIFCAVLINPETKTIEKFIKVNEYDEFKEYTIEKNYLRVAIKPDYFNAVKKIVADLKTTTDSEPMDFSKQLASYQYQVQTSLYLDILGNEFETEFENFFFISVEKQSPYHSAIYDCDRALIEYGRFIYTQRLVKILECFKTNHWPGMEIYSPYEKAKGIIPISLPKWAFVETKF